MFFLREKLDARISEIQRYRFCDMQSILPMRGAMGRNTANQVYNRVPGTIDEFDVNSGFALEGRDRYFWSHARLTLPSARKDCSICGLFVMGQYGHLIGVESMCFVNRMLYQGIDQNHEEVILDDYAGREIDLDLCTWTGMEGKEPPLHVVNHVVCADVGYLWKPADDLFYALKAARQTLDMLDKNDIQAVRLENVLEETLAAINFDEDKIRDTIPSALALLKQGLQGMEKLAGGVAVDVVGATHIDVAWVWRLKHTREKALRSFSTVLRLMDEFPEYVFVQSQPQLYAYVKRDYPELFERIKKRIDEGRWEADGGMWLEADCNLSSGESLIRQFLHGIHFFREEFGVDSTYLWLPDVFGYSWSLPQILKGCGIKTFATTKISWNQFNTMPHDLFAWRGIDGTEIMTFLLTSPRDADDGQGNPQIAQQQGSGGGFDLQKELADRRSSYNTALTARTELLSWLKFREKAYTRTTLIPYGHGDGGGGTTRGMIKTRRMLDLMPGLPTARNVGVGRFFYDMHRDVEASGKPLPVWDGELYLEYHRGTYTSQAANKKWNRRLENRLALTEWLATAAMQAGAEYPAAALYENWETVLRNQFHDIIPGSSIHEVYDESRAEYARVDESLDVLQGDALRALVTPCENAWTIVNFSSFDRQETVELPICDDGCFSDENGNLLTSQKITGTTLVSGFFPALSFNVIHFIPDEVPNNAPLSVLGENILESDRYIVEWNGDGRLTRIYDKEAARETLSSGGTGNRLEVFEDKPLRYDAWDIEIFYEQKCEKPSLTEPVRIIENGPLRTVARFVFGYNRSTITQDMVVARDCRRIEFRTSVDWHEDHRLLKAAFDVDIRATNASYDIQFGYVQRPAHFNTSWDYARFEVCGHKWSDLSESNYGVSILSECKYGFNTRGNTMKISLLKSAKAPDRQADMGEHIFTYALLPHDGPLATAGTLEESTALNIPLLTSAGKATLRRFVSAIGEGVQLDCCKLARDGKGLIVRVHECRGGRSDLYINCETPFLAYQKCNLIEDADGEIVLEDHIESSLRAFEIRTYRLFFPNDM